MKTITQLINQWEKQKNESPEVMKGIYDLFIGEAKQCLPIKIEDGFKWEIQGFKFKYPYKFKDIDNNIFYIGEDKKYHIYSTSYSFTLNNMLDSDISLSSGDLIIHSVKIFKSNDEEVFTVGDYVEVEKLLGSKLKGTITNFHISKVNDGMYCDINFGINDNYFGLDISKIKSKINKTEINFIFKDSFGNQIFEGEEYYFLNTEVFTKVFTGTCDKHSGRDMGNKIYFRYKSEAVLYLIENSKDLSIKEIKTIYIESMQIPYDTTINYNIFCNKLKAKVKEKINTL